MPGRARGQVCLGNRGALTLVGCTHRGRERWWQRRVVTGLPSLADAQGGSATGPHHVSPYAHGQFVATIGPGGNVAFRDAFGRGGRLLGTAVTVRPGEASVKKLADLLAYEAKKNPDSGDPGSEVDSNPYGVLGTRDGAVATDAGGNTLLNITRNARCRRSPFSTPGS